MTESKKSQGKQSGSARRKARYNFYRASKLREQHKLKRVLQSCGVAAANLYAAKHGLVSLLARMIIIRSVVDK